MMTVIHDRLRCLTWWMWSMIGWGVWHDDCGGSNTEENRAALETRALEQNKVKSITIQGQFPPVVFSAPKISWCLIQIGQVLYRQTVRQSDRQMDGHTHTCTHTCMDACSLSHTHTHAHTHTQHHHHPAPPPTHTHPDTHNIHYYRDKFNSVYFCME